MSIAKSVIRLLTLVAVILNLPGCDATGGKGKISLDDLSYEVEGEKGREISLYMTSGRKIDSLDILRNTTCKVGIITLSEQGSSGNLKDGDYDVVELEAKLTEDSRPTPLKLKLKSKGDVIGEITQEGDVLESGDILELTVPPPSGDLEEPPEPPRETVPMC